MNPRATRSGGHEAFPPGTGLPLSTQYVVALGLVLLSLLIRFELDVVLQERAPFVLTLAALAAAALLVTRWPYIVAVAAGLIGIDWICIPPRGRLEITGAADALQLGAFLAASGVLWLVASVAKGHSARARTAAAAVRERDALLATVTEGSAALLCYGDQELKYCFANAAYCRFLGLQRHQIVGRHLQEVLGEAAYAVLAPHLARVLAGERVEFEAELNFATVGWRRMHAVYTPDLAPDGSVVGFTAALTDVTARARAEEALRESESRLRFIIESSPDTIFIQDRELRYIWLGKTSLPVLPEEFLGRTDADLLDDADEAQRLMELKREVMLQGRGITKRLTLRIRGERLDFEVTYQPWRDADGVICGVLGYARDITQRWRDQERLAAIIESTDDAVISKDLSGRIRSFNAGAERLFGYTAAEMFDQPSTLLIPEDRWDEETEVLRRICAGERVHHLETVRRAKDGRLIDVSLTASPIHDASGAVIGVSKIARDITESKRAQQAVAHLAAIVESTDDAVVSKDLTGRIQSFNAGAERIFGYTAAEAIGQSITMLIPEDRLDEEAEILSRIRSGHCVEHLETVRRRKDGRLIDLSITVSPIRDPAGKVIGASKIGRDVTERKRAEARLRRSEEHLRLALEAGQMGSWEWDIRSGAVTWSTSLELIHGLSPGSFAGTLAQAEQFIHPEDRQRVSAGMQRSLESGTDHQVEYRIVRPDGAIAWLECRGRVSPDDAGVAVRMSGVCMDITQRKQAEAQVSKLAADLASRVEELQTLLDVLDVGVLIGHDPDCAQITTNRAAAEMLGIPVGMNASKTGAQADVLPFRVYKDGVEVPGHELPMQRAVRLGVRMDAEELQIARDDGVSVDLWIFASPLFDGAGRIRGVLGTFVDITRRKKQEAELQRYRHSLEELVRERTEQLEQSQHALRLAERMAALGTFAAGLGHDMSNLLLPIRTRLEAIQAHPAADPEIQQDAEAIRGSLRYIESVTRGLRLFAQDPEHDVEGVTDLQRWCGDVEGLLRASLPRSIELRCRIDAAAPPVPVAPHRLSQSILNLVNNARDAITAARGGDGAGVIDLTASVQEDGAVVRLSVRDDGPGMSDEVRRRCTEPFFTTRARALGGSGLGLAIVHGIVQKAGGRIQIDSAVGEGTEVSLLLPAARTPAPQPATDRRVYLSIADQRTAAFAAAIIASLDREPIVGMPSDQASDVLWVTDDTPEARQRAAEVLPPGRGGHVLVLGRGDDWAPLGATVLPAQISLSRLRRALEEALQRSSGRPAAADQHAGRPALTLAPTPSPAEAASPGSVRR